MEAITSSFFIFRWKLGQQSFLLRPSFFYTIVLGTRKVRGNTPIQYLTFNDESLFFVFFS